MDGYNARKDDENGQLSCGTYSSPAAARLLLQRLYRLSLPRSLDNMQAYENDTILVQLEFESKYPKTMWIQAYENGTILT